MKTETKPVYYCDYCNKHLFLKHAMIKHENLCGQNPKNWDACIDCAFCEKIDVTYWIDNDWGGDIEKTAQGFKCGKLDKEMYPFKAAKKNLPARFPGTFEGKEQMPNKCEHKEFIW
jgi:hypothetical protein